MLFGFQAKLGETCDQSIGGWALFWKIKLEMHPEISEQNGVRWGRWLHRASNPEIFWAKWNEMREGGYIEVEKPPQCVFPSASSCSGPYPSLKPREWPNYVCACICICVSIVFVLMDRDWSARRGPTCQEERPMCIRVHFCICIWFVFFVCLYLYLYWWAMIDLLEEVQHIRKNGPDVFVFVFVIVCVGLYLCLCLYCICIGRPWLICSKRSNISGRTAQGRQQSTWFSCSLNESLSPACKKSSAKNLYIARW